jgi:hypothetical protein
MKLGEKMSAADREIELLEEQIAETYDPAERRELERAIREIERELAEEDRWREEGRERGWM